MSDRLPACDKHHPGIESVIVFDQTDVGRRKRCRVCNRVRKSLEYRRLDKIHTTATTYEVLPRLTWDPPQF